MNDGAAIPTIVGLGEALWDISPTGRAPGGAPLNFAYIASLLGARGLIASRIGGDALGAELRDLLKAGGVSVEALQSDTSLPTGVVEVTFADGQPAYDIRQPSAWDALEFTPAWQRLAAEADAVCFGTLAQRAPQSRETIQRFLRATRRDCLRVFDVNLRRPFYSIALVREGLELANAVKFNDAEFEELAPELGVEGASLGEQLRALCRKYALRFACITRGPQGSILASSEEMVEHCGVPVRVQDTVGAGDAFTAALTSSWLAGKSLREAGEAANRWAAWVASRSGGMPARDAETPRAGT